MFPIKQANITPTFQGFFFFLRGFQSPYKLISTEPGIVISFFTNVEVTTSTCVPLSVGVLGSQPRACQELELWRDFMIDTPKGKRTEGVGSVTYSLLARQRGQ